MKLQSKIQKSIKTRGVLPTVILINNILSNIIIRNYLKVKYFIHNIISNEYNNDNYNELLSIKYYTPNYRTYYRAITAHKKERLTRNWIKGMSKGDVLWDIGANIGVFSLLAAKYKINVVCFEPLFSNYYILCKNIEINHDVIPFITALPLALTDNSVIDYLYIPSSDPGNSGSAFGEPLDQYGNDLKYYYKSAVLGMSGDDLQLLLPDRIRNPDHIKIDVDNIEDKIIQGLLNNVLNNSNIKSILVEIDNTFQGKKYIIEKMLYSKGFINYSYDKEATTEDLKCTTYNYIFRKGVNNKMKKTH